MTYFDHNATTPLSTAARNAWLEASEKWIGNPSSPHRAGARAEAALAPAREQIAAAMNCHPADIVWTSGATESSNTVFHHFSRASGAEAEVWISAIEHPSVIEAARHYCGGRVRLIPVSGGGIVEVEWLREQFRIRVPALVAVMAANNETGVLQPWREVLELCRSRGAPFFCDAAQWLGKLPAAGLGECDFVSGSAHKFCGPKGVGFLKCPAGIIPLLHGGSQEDGRRAGTENVQGAIAAAAAFAAREGELEPGPVAERTRWRTEFELRLASLIPGVEVVGANSPRLWNTVMMIMPETDCRRRWVVKLDKAGFAVSTGSACASGREKPSHVLAALGRSEPAAGRALRFSSGWETGPSDWEALAGALRSVYEEFSHGTEHDKSTITRQESHADTT